MEHYVYLAYNIYYRQAKIGISYSPVIRLGALPFWSDVNILLGEFSFKDDYEAKEIEEVMFKIFDSKRENWERFRFNEKNIVHAYVILKYIEKLKKQKKKTIKFDIAFMQTLFDVNNQCYDFDTWEMVDWDYPQRDKDFLENMICCRDKVYEIFKTSIDFRV